MSTYNRKDDLSKAFNDFWQKALNSKEDFYSKLTLQEFVMLKKAITNINNIVTMLATEGFIHTLRNDGVISTKTEIVVTNDHHAEIRKITFKNEKDRFLARIETQHISPFTLIEQGHNLDFTLFDNRYDPIETKITKS